MHLFDRYTIVKYSIVLLVLTPLPSRTTAAQQVILTRGNATVELQAFAPNIVRVTLSLDNTAALKPPGVGITATDAAVGWVQEKVSGGDTFRSDRMVVHVSPESHGTPSGTQADIAKYFNGSAPYIGLRIETPEGKQILSMQDWEMSVPNHKDGNVGVLNDRRPGDDPFFQVSATFAAGTDEHYYGLGQNQQGFLDLRGHSVECAQDYTAAAGPSVCAVRRHQ